MYELTRSCTIEMHFQNKKKTAQEQKYQCTESAPYVRAPTAIEKKKKKKYRHSWY